MRGFIPFAHVVASPYKPNEKIFASTLFSLDLHGSE